MNEEFISKGVESDRYLKAKRLSEQFETDVVDMLERVSREVVEDHPERFEADASQDPNQIFDPAKSDVFATIRVDTRMNRISSAPDSVKTLKLNIAMEWLNPRARGHTEEYGETLTCVHYKIKNATSNEYARVREQTEDAEWDVHFGDDVWGTPSVVYVPVTKYADVENGLQRITNHFAEFGDQFGEVESEDR